MLKNNQGFTLVELMVTIAFIGIMVVASTAVFNSAVHVGKATEERNQALNLAVMVIEELQIYDYENQLLDQGGHNYIVDDLGDNFVINYNVSYPDPGDTDKWKNDKPLIKELEVIVKWQKNGNDKEVQLTTYRAMKIY